jgi:hypothetical protein
VKLPKLPHEVRPINMLPILEKILELCVHEEMIDYFKDNRLFYNKQFGFRRKRSTEDAIQLLLCQWRLTLNKKKAVVAVMLDLKRSFETINRKLLIDKLKCYKVGGVVLKWLEDYLTNRSQVVKLDGDISSELKCDIGVPQGAVLGTLLFIIYMNDIY